MFLAIPFIQLLIPSMTHTCIGVHTNTHHGHTNTDKPHTLRVECVEWTWAQWRWLLSCRVLTWGRALHEICVASIVTPDLRAGAVKIWAGELRRGGGLYVCVLQWRWQAAGDFEMRRFWISLSLCEHWQLLPKEERTLNPKTAAVTHQNFFLPLIIFNFCFGRSMSVC